MKLIAELDEVEIKRAIEAYLAEQGYTVMVIKIEGPTDNIRATADVEKKSD